MNREDRAKQFLPFDALKGLQEELRRREEAALRTERREPSEEAAEVLSRRLNLLKKGSRVHVTYYEGGHYHSLTASVMKVDTVHGILTVTVSGEKREIALIDLFGLQIC